MRSFAFLLCIVFASPSALCQEPSKSHLEKIANGVWKITYGVMDNEHRYSDFAALPPKLDKLNELSDQQLTEQLQKITFGATPDNKVFFRLPTSSDERVFGFGLQFDGLDKTRKIVNLKVDHFNKGGGATHAPVPFFISNKGYGILVNTTKFVKFYNMVGNRKGSTNNPPEVDRNPPPDEKQHGPWLAQPRSDSVDGYIHGRGIELIVFLGEDLMDIVCRYNLFSGGGAMPPLWGLGFWHRVPSKFNSDQIDTELSEFKNSDIPIDVIGLEPGWQTKSYPCTFEWQKKRFPDPEGFTQKLLKQGIRLNLWENPYISKKAKIYPAMYPLSGSHLVWLGIVPDYMLPEARKILIDQHKDNHFDIGISGYKIDEVDGYDNWLWPEHATFPSGTSAEVMRQTYGLQMQKMLFQDLFKKQNQRTWGLVRASNGCASAYPFAIYSDSYGHQQYITGMSTASLCGVLWCPEIRSAKNSQEWINRIHTVCFSPLAMLNAWASKTKPWSFPDKTNAVRKTIELRMRLLPYLYNAYADYAQNGVPPIRSMVLEKFEDGLNDDTSMYMFGPDILVAPLVDDQTKRSILLPSGRWYDFFTGEFVGDGVEINRTGNELPLLFVRDGSLIPMLEKSVAHTDDAFDSDLVVQGYGDVSDQSFDLYEDDGRTFDYLNGKFQYRKFKISIDGDKKFQLEQVNASAALLYSNVRLEMMTKQ